MQLLQRLKRLESIRATAAPATCPDCGHPPHGRRLPEDATKLNVVMDGYDDDDGKPDNCPTCGARLVLRLEFDHPDNDL